MKKYYSLICALLLAQGAMAIDYDQLKKSSKINAASKIELSKLQTQEEKTVVQSKATGSRLKALQKQMDNRTVRAIVRMTPGSDASTLASEGITILPWSIISPSPPSASPNWSNWQSVAM